MYRVVNIKAKYFNSEIRKFGAEEYSKIYVQGDSERKLNARIYKYLLSTDSELRLVINGISRTIKIYKNG